MERMQLPKTEGLRAKPRDSAMRISCWEEQGIKEMAMCPIYVGGEPRPCGFQKLREESV